MAPPAPESAAGNLAVSLRVWRMGVRRSALSRTSSPAQAPLFTGPGVLGALSENGEHPGRSRVD